MIRIGTILMVVVWMMSVAVVQAADRNVHMSVSTVQIIEDGVVVDEVTIEDYVTAPAPSSGKNLKYAYTIVVSFSNFTLYVLDCDGNTVFIAPVALPRHTPKLPVEGVMIAINRKPWWFPPPGMRAYILKTEKRKLPEKVPPGPNSPMGPVKFSFLFTTPGAEQLSKLHGTNHPESIGTHATFGCIRMYNADVLALCDLLEPVYKAGDKIAISYVKDFEGE